MRPLPLESFIIEAVKDEPLPDKIIGFEPGKEYIDLVLTNCPVVIVDPRVVGDQEVLPFNHPDPFGLEEMGGLTLTQPTPNHRRSFTIEHSVLNESWQDEFGHTYGAISLKGNNFSKPGVMETSTAVNRVIARGLQESAVIERVLKASRLLRSNGISTEYILGLAEPKSFPWPLPDGPPDSVEHVSLAEYKRRIVENHWVGLPDEERTIEKLIELSKPFEKMTFYVSARAMDTSVRLLDMVQSKQVCLQVFNYTNQHLLIASEKPYLDPKTDLPRFIDMRFIPRAANNLAKLHNFGRDKVARDKAGLAHRYPNFLNVTAFGSLIDLDSMHGAPLELGDEPITPVDKARDIMELADALDTVAGDFHLGGIEAKHDLVSSFVAQYFISLTLGCNGASNILPEVGEIVLAVDELVRKGAENFDVLRPSFIQKCVEVAFARVYKQVLPDDYRATITDWINDTLDSRKALIVDGIKKNLPSYAPALLDDFVHEFTRNRNFDLIDVCIKDPKQFGEVIDWVQAEIVQIVERSIQYRFKSMPENLDDQPQVAALASALGLLMLKNTDLYSELEDVSAYMSDEILRELQADFKEACQLEWPQTLLSDHEYMPVRMTAQRRFLLETTAPLDEIIDLIDSGQFEVTVEYLECRAVEPNFKVSDDGATLAEVISDGAHSGFGSNFGIPLQELDCSIPSSGSYMLFVEDKPDKTRRLRLHLGSRSLVTLLNERIAELEGKPEFHRELAQALRVAVINQPTLSINS